MTRNRVQNQIFLGGLFWLVFLFLPLETGILRPIAALLLLAMFVIFPLGLLLSLDPSNSEIPPISTRVALFLQPFAALIAGVSFFLPKGVISGTFAIAWLPVTAFATWNGIQILQRFGIRKLIQKPAELCFVVAQFYVPIGAIWLLASRLGIEPLGFSEPIVLLTAIHFHFAGFAAPILAGLVGREMSKLNNSGKQQPRKSTTGRGYTSIAIIVMSGPVLVAVGITFSPLVEAVAGTILAVGYTGLAVMMFGLVIRQVHRLSARVFIIISALSAIVTMLAAAGYALRTFNLFPFFEIPQMVAVHGWGNAVGFVFCGLLGWGLNQKSAT